MYVISQPLTDIFVLKVAIQIPESSSPQRLLSGDHREVFLRRASLLQDTQMPSSETGLSGYLRAPAKGPGCVHPSLGAGAGPHPEQHPGFC